jgi:signal transduction histidine kinase
VRATVEGARDEAESAGMHIRLSVPPRPVEVAIESDLLERIVHPLLDNAIRYGRSEVSVDVRVSGTSAFVEVGDDGAGLDAGETDTVFEPGARGSAAIGDPRGAGLGLALARRLARSAGGEIVARASDGGGRFSVRLPLA